MRSTTALFQLQRVLRAAGIATLYGEPGPGLVHVRCRTPEVAAALARAHREVHGEPAGVHLGDGRIVVGDDPGEPLQVSAPAELDGLVEELAARLSQRGSLAVELTCDPATRTNMRPVPPAPDPPRWLAPEADLVEAVRSAQRPMALVGPGVVTADAVADLHGLAAAADLGVLNTWGAKGVFDWRSRHHWATVGLQARDLELGGLPESDVVVLTGLDLDELPPGGVVAFTTITVQPLSLGPLAELWSRPRGELTPPVLRERLGAVTQAGWAAGPAPLRPSRVTRTYGDVLGARGTVVADPGLAGYWVARTFGTTRLGGAIVPSRGPAPGSAIAAAIVGLLGGRAPLIAAGAGPLDELDVELLETASRLGVGTGVAIERWTSDGEVLDADRHRDRLVDALAAEPLEVLTIATDPTQLDAMIEAAGPVTAWGGLVHEQVERGGAT